MDKRRDRSRESRAQRGDRRSEGELCWGRNPVMAALEDMSGRCAKVFISKSAQGHVKDKIISLCKNSGVLFQLLDNQALDRMTDGENHQGVVAQMSPTELLSAEDLIATLPEAPAPAMLLLCDRIQDPHNLGAIIRSAEAAGASGVLFPKRGGCLPTGVVVKTSAGAALRMKLAMTGNVSQTVKLLQDAGFWTIGLAMEAEESLFKGDLPVRTALVIGSEGEGLGRAVAKNCDELRYIPMDGECGSLNASVAAALAMFEWYRVVKAEGGT
jgi:23S rRNA (guanosine2251-2'-O)-methyltransferase